MRVTKHMLAMQFLRTCQSAKLAGVAEAADWRMDTGSKVNGIAYRLWRARPELGSGHYRPALGTDFLGMTASEAYTTLRSYGDAFYAVVDAREQRTED